MHQRTTRNWVATYTGRAFWPLTPRVEDFDIRDVAHHLAVKCRWGGATRGLYSVAQHCVAVADHVLSDWPNPQWALMHDVGEAYLPDVQRPYKHLLTGFQQLEESIQQAAARWLELPWPIPAEVDQIDNAILRYEQQAYLAPQPMPLPFVIQGRRTIRLGPALDWEAAEELFLFRFAELFGDPARWHGEPSPDYGELPSE